jgi:hypothetical protein
MDQALPVEVKTPSDQRPRQDSNLRPTAMQTIDFMGNR